MQPIGFFDSGIGGLTVLHEALKILPNESYLYFADSDHAPYGTRPSEEVLELFLNAMDFIMAHDVKAIVVACNTATGVGIDIARQRYASIPIIGMEPAVKPAVAAAADKRVLVFATELTLKMEKFKNLVEKVDTANVVDYLPLQKLVVYAERFEFEEAPIFDYLQAQFEGIDLHQYGAVVLGCTHFPFFKNMIRKMLPAHIQIIDGNQGTVNNLQNKLQGRLSAGPGSISYFISGKPAENARFERYFNLL
ncbi:MAG: glutamate racemase [Bacteroidota bacterium]